MQTFYRLSFNSSILFITCNDLYSRTCVVEQFVVEKLRVIYQTNSWNEISKIANSYGCRVESFVENCRQITLDESCTWRLWTLLWICRMIATWIYDLHNDWNFCLVLPTSVHMSVVIMHAVLIYLFSFVGCRLPAVANKDLYIYNYTVFTANRFHFLLENRRG